MPAENSAIFVSDFSNVEDLAKLLLAVNASDIEYEKYLRFKRPRHATDDDDDGIADGGVTNERLRRAVADREWTTTEWGLKPNFVESFECLVCRRVHEEMLSSSSVVYQATREHYSCPKPRRFSDKPPGNLEMVDDMSRSFEWTVTRRYAAALRQLVDENRNVSREEIYRLANVEIYDDQM